MIEPVMVQMKGLQVLIIVIIMILQIVGQSALEMETLIEFVMIGDVPEENAKTLVLIGQDMILILIVQIQQAILMEEKNIKQKGLAQIMNFVQEGIHPALIQLILIVAHLKL